MNAQLKILQGAKAAVIRLKLPTTIGRSTVASLKVPQSQVSRQHCEIYEEDGMLVVDDVGSSNGTFINDERIDEPTFLYPGEKLRVGKIVFEAIYEAPSSMIEHADPEGTEIIETEPATASADIPSTTSPIGDHRGCEDVLDASCAEVNYNENEEGSFLGIREIDTGAPSISKASESAKNIDCDGVAARKEVDPGDSALNDFFKNLE